MILHKKDDMIAKLILPRHKNSTTAVNTASSSADNIPLTPKEFYKRIYINSYDYAIYDRFNQPDFIIYRCLQDILLKSVAGGIYEEEINKIEKVYHNEVDIHLLKTQLRLLKTMMVNEISLKN